MINEEIINNNKLDSISKNIDKAIKKYSKQFDKTKNDKNKKKYSDFLDKLDLLAQDIDDLKKYNLENNKEELSKSEYKSFVKAVKEVDNDIKTLLGKNYGWVSGISAGAGSTAVGTSFAIPIAAKLSKGVLGGMAKTGLAAAGSVGLGASILAGTTLGIMGKIVKNIATINKTKKILSNKDRHFIKESCFNY